ncbi:hypothetical protein Snoj_48480 [Streptomyces nojiriensis]|uniref:Secreted protein n=1 Tax=Streptomyces nojiriensis TaxID=66374 RepID=A0ABQ3SS19_9ACTN|nr:hypothetical protein [Streptomyces nojiriensis]QTI44488.1 hypothetical protein JYK04_02264 [Streptomyces nojiriensis]GGS05666.1 hypothetical protein GCM10010205_38450 [Streptomyces nojiriensis]GHI70930.1 hypothetical protein Snoj_48480 [Streptomyces nojiriensis]
MTTTTPRTAILGEPEPTAQPAHADTHTRRHPARVLAATLCVLLGTGLVGGAALTTWAEHRAAARPLPADAAYRKAGSLWRAAPVDSLLPPVLTGPSAGPGGSHRTWTRIALAPDADCPAALAADWQALLAATGCTRVLRATYTDATRSSLITVGMVFTPADAPAMTALAGRIPAPPAYGFTDAQRAAWASSVPAEAPVVVYAVSAFADGRPLDAPRPAEDLMKKDATGAAAQAGLGHEARALADRVGRGLAFLAAPPAPSATPASTAPTAPEPTR